MRRLVVLASFFASLILLLACGGDTVSVAGLFNAGDGGPDATFFDAAPSPSDAGASDAADAAASDASGEAGATTVTLGGTVSGLGGGTVILKNGSELLSIGASGAYTFKTPLATGASYAVTVASQPSMPTQNCLVTNGTGVAGTTAINDVNVVCTTSKFKVPVTVTGLTGTGLVLQNDFGDDLSVNADGTFDFATSVDSGNTYNVTVKTEPSSPAQTCNVTGGTGVVGGSDVSGVSVLCGVVGAVTLGGQISGLNGTVVLQNNGGDNRTLTSTSGTFTFATPIAPGSIYSVTVLTQPSSPSQTCTVSAGVGIAANAPITSVRIACVTNSFPVTVNVTGLTGQGLVLQDNSTDNLSITGNGAFTFATPIASGTQYTVSVLTLPNTPAQTCTFTNPSEVMGNSAASVGLSCSTTTYAIKVDVVGLTNTALFLENNTTDNLAVGADGTYTFPTRLAGGAAFNVQISGQQGPQSCSVNGGVGRVIAGDVTVGINCQTNTYAVSGTVTGLAGTVILQNEGGDNQTVSGTTFAFTPQPNGAAYSITVFTQPGSPSQTCTVRGGNGTLMGADVKNVALSCTTNSYTVGGTVTGLSGTGLVLQNNGVDSDTITANGAFTFKTALASGSSYAVTAFASPTGPSQTCSVTNGSGAVGASNVNNVIVSCSTTTYAIGGNVTGLAGTGLLLRDNSDTYSVADNGTFTFNTQIASGGMYNVSITQQPSSPTQSCALTFTLPNGNSAPSSGTINTAADVPVIGVTCTTTSFSVGGTISGLASNDTITLLDNLGDSTTFTGNGTSSMTFSMHTAVASGSPYSITVGTPPGNPPQTCNVSGGSGTVGSGPVTSVTVNCATNTYTVGGTLTGLAGGAVVLQDNMGDNLTLAANVTFAFAKPIASGGMYNVTVLTQPSSPSQSCTVSGGTNGDGTGTIGSANDTSLTVSCVTNTYSVIANVTGLGSTDTLTLQLNHAETLTETANGMHTFVTQIPSGQLYDVSGTSSYASARCTGGEGVVGGGNVTVSVVCRYPVNVTATRVDQSITLYDDGEDAFSISKNGTYTFATYLLGGAPYDIATTNPTTPFAQTCTVTNGSNTVTGPVTNVTVACTPPVSSYAATAQGSNGEQMCAIASDGSLWCWGNNSDGEVGNGTTTNQSGPAQVGTSTWTTVAVGGGFTCGIKTDGTLWCWGLNSSGQLGNGSTTMSTVPVPVTSVGGTWIAVATGGGHACAIQPSHAMYCWGSAQFEQLGVGAPIYPYYKTPVQVYGNANWASVTAGNNFTCGIRTDGTLWCWGDNSYGEQGTNFVGNCGGFMPSGANVGTPWPVCTAPNQTLPPTWLSVSAGAVNACGIQTGGSLYCWGNNSSGQNGNNSSPSYPIIVASGKTWSQVSVGTVHACGISTSGALFCWGLDNYSQLGDNSTTQQNTPEAIGTATTWSSISCTDNESYGLQSGPLFGWGRNDAMLGYDTGIVSATNPVATPTQVP